MTGLGELLNLASDDHLTVVVCDFEPTVEQRTRIGRQFEGVATRLKLIVAADAGDAEAQLEEARRAHPASYLSLQLLSHRHDTYASCARFFHGLERKDMARLELPVRGLGFSSSQVDFLLDVLEDSDFAEQQRYSNDFFSALESAAPYTVEIITPGARLAVTGAGPWFQLAGPLTADESRILPGGEVAYTGDDVSGTFVVDGTLLATPQGPDAIEAALALQQLMPQFRSDPVTFTIEKGVVRSLHSAGTLAERLRSLLAHRAYARLVEVGVSFNRACRGLVYDWPASANEGYPGAHLGVGGDPAPDDDLNKDALVHIDFISRDAQVFVNGSRFVATRDLVAGAAAP